MMHDDAHIVELLHTACKAEGSQRKWAQKHGLSFGHVYNVLSGRRAITDRLAKALGMKRVHGWDRAEEQGHDRARREA